MISERVGQLHESSTTLRQRRSQRDRTAVWSAHAHALEECAISLERPRQFLTWLQGISPAAADNPHWGAEARAETARLKEALHKDPEQVLNGKLIERVRSATKVAADRLEAEAKKRWSGYVEELPPPDADLYAAFRDEAEFERLVREAERQDSRYRDLRSRQYLSTDDERSEFVRLMKSRQETRGRLPDIRNEEIRTFVALAARDGAPLPLGAAVLDWLARNGYDLLRRSSPHRAAPAPRAAPVSGIGSEVGASSLDCRVLDQIEDAEFGLLSWGIVDGGFEEYELLDRIDSIAQESRGCPLCYGNPPEP